MSLPDTHDEVRRILTDLSVRFAFRVEDFHSDDLTTHRILPRPSESCEVEIIIIPRRITIATGADMRFELDVDDDGAWAVKLKELLEGVMANGVTERIWRWPSGGILGSTGRIQTSGGDYRSKSVIFPFNWLLRSEDRTYPPYAAH